MRYMAVGQISKEKMASAREQYQRMPKQQKYHVIKKAIEARDVMKIK